MKAFGPPEKVYVELDWYDGPRSGVADINGVPHRFLSQFDEADDEWLGSFLVFPVDAETLSLELEQWKIFADWNALYEQGVVSTDTHPGTGGLNARWDQIELLLQKARSEIPANAIRADAKFIRIDRENRYEADGPDYMLCWSLHSDHK